MNYVKVKMENLIIKHYLTKPDEPEVVEIKN